MDDITPSTNPARAESASVAQAANSTEPMATAPASSPSPTAPGVTATVNPATPASSSPTPASPTNTTARGSNKLIFSVIALMLIIFAGLGGFAVGRSNMSKPTPPPLQTPISELTVPQNATVIAQCAKGRGTQYVLPKDIPLGPVYNVYNNKVIGIEYMVGKDDLLGGKSFLNLTLAKQTYDHINIGLLSTGHAGYPVPHYHIDIMTVPTSITDQIKC